MGKKPIVELRVYRGTEMNYDANGVVKNENQTVTLEYQSRSWVLFMENIKRNGYCKVDVEKVYNALENGYEEVNDISLYKNEVHKNFTQEKQVNLTPEQKRIAELEAKLEKLLGNSADVSFKEEIKEQVNVAVKDEQDRDAVVAEYTEKVGRKPFGGWDIETIKQKQAEHLAK